MIAIIQITRLYLFLAMSLMAVFNYLLNQGFLWLISRCRNCKAAWCSLCMMVVSQRRVITSPYKAPALPGQGRIRQILAFLYRLTIITNQLTLNNGQTVVLSSNNLQAVEQGVTNNSQIVFTVANVQNGYFATVPSSNSPVKKYHFIYPGADSKWRN